MAGFTVTYDRKETVFHNVLEQMGDEADAMLLGIAKEIAAAAKQEAPVRKKAKKKGYGGKTRYKGAKTTKPGELKRSIKAARRGKRYKQDGKWRFHTTRIAISMRYYGMWLDRGWIHAKTGRQIIGTMFLTKHINRRLVRGI